MALSLEEREFKAKEELKKALQAKKQGELEEVEKAKEYFSKVDVEIRVHRGAQVHVYINNKYICSVNTRLCKYPYNPVEKNEFCELKGLCDKQGFGLISNNDRLVKRAFRESNIRRRLQDAYDAKIEESTKQWKADKLRAMIESNRTFTLDLLKTGVPLKTIEKYAVKAIREAFVESVQKS